MDLKPLGRNIGRYNGQLIDIQEVLQEMQQSLARAGWQRDSLPLPSLSSGGMPLEFVAYRRQAVENPRRRLYLSTGIHGDEPAGPLALLQLLQENRWPEDFDLWICPCLNLTGFPLNRRENAAGIDLNRDYRHLQSEEIRTHVAWLKEQPSFDLALCLHEDWESAGFYLYELNPDNRPSLAARIIERVGEVCPIDRATLIEGWPAENGIIRPQVVDPAERPLWPESIFLLSSKTRQSFTLEAPSDFALPVRVQALKAAVRTVLEEF